VCGGAAQKSVHQMTTCMLCMKEEIKEHFPVVLFIERQRKK
jgi:hypothetical protein